jgi:putative DNA primase/helicase
MTPVHIEGQEVRLVSGDYSSSDWEQLLPTVAQQADPLRQFYAKLPDQQQATDVGNAERLARRASGRLRYVSKWGRYLVYRDGRWVVCDDDALGIEEAKGVAQDLFHLAARDDLTVEERAATSSWAIRSQSAGALRAMLGLTHGMPGIHIEHDQLDRWPWLLNVRNGTIDLETGEFREHRATDLLTLQAPVTYDLEAAAPLWMKCLERWQPDPDLRRYLQMMIGSGATGHPVERLLVCHGTGANGKGRFFGAVSDVLGPYVVVPHRSLLIETRQEDAAARAALFGARLLVAEETSLGERLAETSIKNLTGQDRLSARRLYENPWHFDPTWTAALHTNHRPTVRGTDEGIWRRVRLIPWEVTIPEAERDTRLRERLQAEASGILNWLIEGALLWRDDPEWEPDAVRAATADYRGESDVLGRFLAEECATGPTCRVRASDLRDRYVAWCEREGVPPEAPQVVAPSMRARGFTSERRGGGVNWWVGVGLQPREQGE